MRKKSTKFLTTLVVLAMVISMLAGLNVTGVYGAGLVDPTEIFLFVGTDLYSVNKAYLETSSGDAATWTSADTTVATVNSIGEVTALAAGESIITAVSGGGTETWKAVVLDMPAISIPGGAPAAKPPANTYPQNDSVHDPEILYVESEDLYYLVCTNTRNFRSSPDLVNWTNVYTIPTTASALASAHVRTEGGYTSSGYWAPNLVYNPYMERYVIYFSASNSYGTGRGIGNKCSAIGMSILEPRAGVPYSLANSVASDWVDGGIVVKSYDAWAYPGQRPRYTLNIMSAPFQFGLNNRLSELFGPNAIDPQIFWDKTGEKLYMVYGSFFDGMHVLELDRTTGLPYNQSTLDPQDPNYNVRYNTGICVARRGGSYAFAQPFDLRRQVNGEFVQTGIEGPCIFYSEETDYYYMMVSYDDLAHDYNVRISRSRTPEGPHYDYNGFNMVTYSPENLSRLDPAYTFTNIDIELDPGFIPEPLLGDYDGYLRPGETLSFDPNVGTRMLSPYRFDGGQNWIATGHNCVFMTREGEWAIGSHAKNPQRLHVRKLLWTEDEWPMASPARYTGESIEQPIDASRVVGTFELAVMDRIRPAGQAAVVTGTFANLNRDGTVTSASAQHNGTWLMYEGNKIDVTIDDVTYKGQVAVGWDWENWDGVEIVFAGLSDDGTMLWGKGGSVLNFTALTDKSDLLAAIEEAEEFLLDPSLFTVITYDALYDEYVLAQGVYDDPDAVQSDIDAAAAAVRAAILALDPVPFIVLSGPDSVVTGAGATATYTISAKDMHPLSAIDIEITVDGSILSSKEFTIESGFERLSDANYGTELFWTNVGDIWTGRAILYTRAAGGLSGDFEIFTMVFSVAEGELGSTDVKLNYALTSFGGDPIPSGIAGNGIVTTDLLQWYSPFDLNKDGVIDLNDITFALQYLLLEDGDTGWDVAKVADVNNENIIDARDLSLILSNYTIPYYG